MIIILNSNQLQSDGSDFTERAAFSIGSGSVKVRKYIIRFSSGSLFAILKNTAQVWLRFDKNSVKQVYKTPVRVRFDSLAETSSCPAITVQNTRFMTSQHDSSFNSAHWLCPGVHFELLISSSATHQKNLTTGSNASQ